MSEIYLTKIERKTIFTKSLIFVLIMFVISDLTVTGPFWFNFIPWMYILGTLGSLKKIDSILMTVIGTFTVFVASIITQASLNFTGIMNTVVALATIVLGILTGKILYEFILEHRLVKYIKRSKKITYIVMIIVMLFASWFMVGLNSGNIVTYLKSRANLKQYIEKTYNIQEYSVIRAKYDRQFQGKYAYSVKIAGEEVYFVPVTKEIFNDANRNARLVALENKLEQELGDSPEKIAKKYTYLTNTQITYRLEYSKLAITPDTVVMSVLCKTDLQDEQELDKLYDELANCIKELQALKQPQKIIITVNDSALQLSKENVDKLDKEYIKGGFEIEEITE